MGLGLQRSYTLSKRVEEIKDDVKRILDIPCSTDGRGAPDEAIPIDAIVMMHDGGPIRFVRDVKIISYAIILRFQITVDGDATDAFFPADAQCVSNDFIDRLRTNSSFSTNFNVVATQSGYHKRHDDIYTFTIVIQSTH